MGFQYYDRVAFINRDRMRRYVEAGIVSRQQAVLVGYPKLDRLALGHVDGAGVRQRLGMESGRPTVLYAPTYSTASSLHLAGESIVESLSAAGWNVLVKLHDRSLDPDPRYSGGIDWRARMRALERPGRIAYVEGPDVSPYLAAADAMVTDHSSAGFEYLVLDRPLLVYDAPDLARAARINPDKIARLRSAADVVHTPEALVQAAAGALRDPGRLSRERRRVAEEMFFQPGGATARAVALLQGLLRRGLEPAEGVVDAAQPVGGVRP
jgi:CDP-glycerol glycerophosphotransferase (TagB/SpsB family)